MRDLLEAGIHFGHQTRRWNPKMKKYIYGQRNGIYIIDLQKTMAQLRKATALVRETAARGGSVLFVGTKKQAAEAISREAERCGMHYVNNRWLGGTLTNFATVKKSVRRLLDQEAMETDGSFDKLQKKEVVRVRKNTEKLDKNLSGIKSLKGLPDVMFVIDARKEAIAIKEAKRLGIPCISIVDTNSDPDSVPIPIPGNDDAIRAVNLFCAAIADAAIEGKSLHQKFQADEMKKRQAAKPAPKAEAPAKEATEEKAAEPAVAEEAAAPAGGEDAEA
jgi:small subunit ribosomal protein S2